MTRIQRFMELAAAEAGNSQQETKHGSLLVRGGKILGSGHNSSRSRLQAMPGASNVTSLHSEVRTLGHLTMRPSQSHIATTSDGKCTCVSQVAALKTVPWVLQGSR